VWCGPGPARNSGAGPLARRANPASTTIAIPLAPAASSRSETSFQAVMTMVVPFPAARARWALVTRQHAQSPVQFLEVGLDQVAGRSVPGHAGRPGTGAPRAGLPSTACTPRANLRHSVRCTARAAAPSSVRP
jgi:hypothetical protein